MRRLLLHLISFGRSFIFLLHLFFCSTGLNGQDKSNYVDPRQFEVDSLLVVLKNTGQDSIKVRAINGIAYRKYILVRSGGRADYEPAIKYVNEALLLAQKIHVNNRKEKQTLQLARY